MSKNSKVATTKSTKNNPGRYNFLSLANVFAPISILITLAALMLIFTKGFNYGIDFAGGTEVQVQFAEQVPPEKVRKFTNDMGMQSASVQAIGEKNEYLIRTETVAGKDEQETQNNMNAMITKITEGLKSAFASENPTIRQVNSVGPQVGAELKRNGMLAMFYALLVILIYIGLRFDYQFAPGAVFCLFHDAIVTLGIYSILSWEVNLQTMAAILTLIGYSLNDTIVIYDRVRENLEVYRDESFAWVINRSINDCLGRTILTSGITMLAVASLWFIAGGVIAEFARTMAIGMVLGTYSTIYVAAPLVILVHNLINKRAARTA